MKETKGIFYGISDKAKEVKFIDISSNENGYVNVFNLADTKTIKKENKNENNY